MHGTASIACCDPSPIPTNDLHMAIGALTIKLTVAARGPYIISIHGAFWPEPRSDEVFGNDRLPRPRSRGFESPADQDRPENLRKRRPPGCRCPSEPQTSGNAHRKTATTAERRLIHALRSQLPGPIAPNRLGSTVRRQANRRSCHKRAQKNGLEPTFSTNSAASRLPLLLNSDRNLALRDASGGSRPQQYKRTFTALLWFLTWRTGFWH